VNCTSADVARYQLLKMLKALRDSPFKDAGWADIYDAKMPLLEVYITQFLSLVNQLIKRGIRSDYISVQKNSRFIKGRILIAQQLRRNTFHQERFYIEYQEYQVNRPANRLIKSALLLVAKLACSAQNQRLSREFGFVFDEVPASSEVRTDFQRLKTDRTMGYYKDVLSWCRLLLQGHGPTATAGALNTLTLVYPMERIFEDYVAQCLKKKLLEYFPNADRLKTQARKHYLVSEHDGSPIFNLRPDLFVLNGKQNICVMDTKWKLVDSSDRAKKYGISQADMYQLYAYGHKYLKGAGSKELLLIYPKTAAFSSPLPGFNYEDGFRLRVVPFDIDTGELVGLPEYKEIGIPELN
jgi:5-methylcytosine-specific restriction enzyme subunit McrC